MNTMNSFLRLIARLCDLQPPPPREFRAAPEARESTRERPDLSWVAYRLHE